MIDFNEYNYDVRGITDLGTYLAEHYEHNGELNADEIADYIVDTECTYTEDMLRIAGENDALYNDITDPDGTLMDNILTATAENIYLDVLAVCDAIDERINNGEEIATEED